MTVERSVVPRDERPRARVRRCFAGEIPGIKLPEGSIDVVGVEYEGRHYPVVTVDLGDVEHVGADVAPAHREADATEDHALPARRDDR